jgi:hypothetical protein
MWKWQLKAVEGNDEVRKKEKSDDEMELKK